MTLAAPLACVVLSALVGELPPLREDLGERRVPREDEIVADTVGVLKTLVERKLEARQTGTRALRDVHAKSHGCVRARFEVLEDVPAELRAGVFARAGTFDATIRFSSSELQPEQADWEASFRGMGIAVHGVEGRKLLEHAPILGGRANDTQDFVFNNRPAFPLADVGEYHDAMIVRRDGALAAAMFAATHPHAIIPISVDAKRIPSPLRSSYWSMTALALGSRAVKLEARPCTVRRQKLPSSPRPDYLRETMVQELAAADACFELLAQVRTPENAAHLPIEDAHIVWSEELAPPVRLARIVIPSQVFDTPEANAACERMELNPWHALPEHQPLGSLNRARLVVYSELAKFRAAHNGLVDRPRTARR